MPIDQTSLNKLLAMVNPKSKLTTLREYRDGIQKKLNQATQNTADMAANPANSSESTDTKHVILELASADKQIQQAIYEEETQKLELERLKREEAMAKSAREREKLLAKHERALENASIRKLYSAIANNSQAQTMAGSGSSFSFNQPSINSNNASHPQNSLEGKVDAVERDLKESVEYGIAAAEVARRRKNNEVKANLEEVADKKAKKPKRKNVNITV